MIQAPKVQGPQFKMPSVTPPKLSVPPLNLGGLVLPRGPLLWVAILAIFLGALSGSWRSAYSQSAASTTAFCKANEKPAFRGSFTTLKKELGAVMGDPVVCAHENSENGDTLQETTTGLAFIRKSTNAVTFTDGNKHWALFPKPRGMVTWEGSSSDPPPSALTAAPVPGPAAPR